MTTETRAPASGATAHASAPAPAGEQQPPTLAEDLLLLLFQPDAGWGAGAGAIAGEGTLFSVLGGAVLTELVLGGHVRTDERGRAPLVEAAGQAPTDPLLRAAWGYIAKKPRAVQTVLAAIGPTLRSPVLARVIRRGDIRERHGLFGTRVLEGDGGERRAALMAAVRALLVDGAEPSPRIAALAALMSGSGAMPQFDREIPWTSPVITRAKALEHGDWGAGAAGEAVTRTLTALIVNSVIGATAARPRT